MARKLFCELHPLAYKLAVIKGILCRKITWIKNSSQYAKTFSEDKLPQKIYTHSSLIRRKLGDVDMRLQNNKAINLSLAAPKINGVLIQPGETFSFWRLVGNCSEKKGYKEGLVIKSGKISQGIGGGMCQLSNLVHWMILHSPLTIVEHHHHNQIDMFPDFGRQVPFGSGTSIMYNYLDYQVKNETDQTFQLIVYTTDTHLCGELRSERELSHSYHVYEENSWFVKEPDGYYRTNEIYVKIVNKTTGDVIARHRIIKNYSKVVYDAEFIPLDRIKEKNYNVSEA
ncbi:VanW family protein [Vallitaleaceae bacterium 9-2]